MDLFTITYEGKEYPARYSVRGSLISVDSLSDALLNEDSEPVSTEAEELYDSISGFVTDKEILLSDYGLYRRIKELGIID